MTQNTKEVVTKLKIIIKKKTTTTTIKKNSTINLILTLNYCVGSHKNRDQEQLGFRDT